MTISITKNNGKSNQKLSDDESTSDESVSQSHYVMTSSHSEQLQVRLRAERSYKLVREGASIFYIKERNFNQIFNTV